MISIGNRIKEIRNDSNLTQDKFGEKIGVKKSALSLIEKDERSLTDSVLKNIINEFCVNEVWLKDGIGEKYNEKLKKEKEFMLNEFHFMSELLLSRQQLFFQRLKDYGQAERVEMITVLEEIYSILDTPNLNTDLFYKYYESSATLMMETSRYLHTLDSPDQYDIYMFDKTLEAIKENLMDITKLFIPDIKLNISSIASTENNVSDYQEHYRKKLISIEVDEDELELINMYRNLSLNDKEEVKMFAKFRAENSPSLKKKGTLPNLAHGEEAATKKHA